MAGPASARTVIEAAVGLCDIVIPSADDLTLLYGPASPGLAASCGACMPAKSP